MNNYNLKGRRAIVTGGAQGFGYAITKRFLESGAEVIIWDIDQKAIDEALKKLSTAHREILELKFLEEFSNQEIAKITGKTEGNIRIMQLRALRELRKFFPSL